MPMFWVKLNIVNREIKGRDFTQRRSDAFEALRANCEALAAASFHEEIPTFFIYKSRKNREVVMAVRAVLADGDNAVSGRFDTEGAATWLPGTNVLAAAPALTPAQKEASFDDYWR